MIRSRLLYAALLGAGLGVAALSQPSWVPAAHAEEDNKVRPEVGKPLQEADGLIKQGKFREALAKVHEVDKIANKTPYENYVTEYTRMSAANSAGDIPEEIKGFEGVVATGRMPAAQELQLMEAIAGQYYKAQDYPNTIVWLQRFFKQGGSDPAAHQTLYQAYYLAGDFANAVKELKEAVANDEKAGRVPPEQTLQLLRSSEDKLGDKPGTLAATEKLLTNYPKKEYWLFVLHDVEARAGFADRLAVDLERLRIATDTMGRGSTDPTAASNQYFEMIQQLVQAGQVGEAKAITDKTFGAGILGAGADADRQKRLRDLVNKTAVDDQKSMAQGDAEALAAKDGNGLVNQGFNYVGYGQYPKGIGMMEQGIAKGGLKHPEDAKLHLAYAYLQSGQKPKAIALFKTVGGTDGTADLARLWVVYASK